MQDDGYSRDLKTAAALWFDRGRDEGMTYMLIYRDELYDNIWPTFAKTIEEARAKRDNPYRFMVYLESYDLTLSKEEQLALTPAECLQESKDTD
jgi:hypothetical protein